MLKMQHLEGIPNFPPLFHSHTGNMAEGLSCHNIRITSCERFPLVELATEWFLVVLGTLKLSEVRGIQGTLLLNVISVTKC